MMAPQGSSYSKQHMPQYYSRLKKNIPWAFPLQIPWFTLSIYKTPSLVIHSVNPSLSINLSHPTLFLVPLLSSVCSLRPSTFLLGIYQKFIKARQSTKRAMTIEEIKEEGPPLLKDAEAISKPRKIALFVEPSPFAYVSGYKNRFQNFIKNLREMGDEVHLHLLINLFFFIFIFI